MKSIFQYHVIKYADKVETTLRKTTDHVNKETRPLSVEEINHTTPQMDEYYPVCLYSILSPDISDIPK
uniref:Uncharacterized protein n=1 Tax=Parascaris univalens TaxID=6257 RepID=A0A914ZYH6_PARUN